MSARNRPPATICLPSGDQARLRPRPGSWTVADNLSRAPGSPHAGTIGGLESALLDTSLCAASSMGTDASSRGGSWRSPVAASETSALG